MPVSRPVLVAIAVALCGANCSDGTCQTLQSYFDCEFDGSGGGGGGNTIAAASCARNTPIVVRTSFQFVNSSMPAIFKQGLIQHANDEASFFFNRQEALRVLQIGFHKGHFKTDEALFVARALFFGLGNDARPSRRWIPKREVARERMWREQAVWQTPTVFAVAPPAAECEFCLRIMPLRVYEWE